MSIFEEWPPGPTFDIKHEVFEPPCRKGEGCNPMLSMCFMRGWEDAPQRGMNPAALVCHGLRAVTKDETEHIRTMGWELPEGELCDLEMRYVPETGEPLIEGQ
jgi:hypothetical protein